jgi:uncharacterized protein
MPQDWIMGLGGGILIGLAAALLLLGNGRIMGASGIVGSLVDGTAGPDRRDRLVFLAGLVLVPGTIALVRGGVATHATTSIALLVLAGLLVGIGTRLANGCTSGHGVCGISRLSPRGIVATVIYIGAGAVTVVALRALTGAF